MNSKQYTRLCDWCNEQLVGIENHTSNAYSCSNPECPHDHGGYIRCDDVDTCRKTVSKTGGDIKYLNSIFARRFTLNSTNK